MNAIRSALFHLVNGIYSGIPVCCVLFFVRWCWIRSDDEPCGSTVYEARTGDPCGGRAQYVQCDRCWHLDHVAPLKFNGGIARWLQPKRTWSC